MMLTWSATKLFLRKAWAHLKKVPAWVWAILGWTVAYLAWKSSKRNNVKTEIQTERLLNLKGRNNDLFRIRYKRDKEIEKAEKEYQKTKQEIQKKREKLDKAAGDSDSITKAVNDAFGGDE